MKLLLQSTTLRRLRRELRGRRREIGGVLVGEHVKDETFRLADLSVQRSGGTAAHFERDPAHHKTFLADFFAGTGHDYTRFNYIGEWHSHPSFEPLPSGEDCATMAEIVEDPDVGVNFAVLIIARLRALGRMELSATLFRRGASPEPVEVEIESDGRRSALRRLLDFIRR
jgi:proteasome lid subunit RPN8/RPN11